MKIVYKIGGPRFVAANVVRPYKNGINDGGSGRAGARPSTGNGIYAELALGVPRENANGIYFEVGSGHDKAWPSTRQRLFFGHSMLCPYILNYYAD